MTWSALSALVNGISSLLLMLFLLPRFKELRPRMFIYYLIPPTLWSFSYFAWQIADDATSALFWVRMLTLFASFIPAVYIEFVCVFSGINRRQWLIQIIKWAPLVLSLNLFSTYFIQGVGPKLEYLYWPTAGPIYAIYLAAWFLGLIYALALLLQKQRQTSGLLRSQIGLIIMGTFIGYLGGATNYPLWFNIPIPPIGNILVAVSVIFFFYAVIVQKLFDFRGALARTVLFTVLLGLILAFFGGIMFTLSNIIKIQNPLAEQALNLLAVLVVGFAFSPLVNLIKSLTDRLFYKKEYEYHTVLSQLSDRLNSVVALEEALNLVMQTAAATLHLNNGTTYVYQPGLKEDDKPEVKVYSLDQKTANPKIPSQELINFFYKQTNPTVTDELKNQVELEDLNLAGLDQRAVKRALKSSSILADSPANLIRKHAIKESVLNRLHEAGVGAVVPLNLNLNADPTSKQYLKGKT